jgi:hypothetical protein
MSVNQARAIVAAFILRSPDITPSLYLAARTVLKNNGE